MAELTAEVEKNIRSNWVVGDWVEVYSKSRDQWFPAKIIEIYDDDDGEWLAVVVENTMIKEVQRFTPDVRPYFQGGDDDSDSVFSDTDEEPESSAGDHSTSADWSDSQEDEKERLHRKQKKKAKQLSKHHEMVVIFVERSGTNMFNGKYVYSTTTEDGYPIFEHVDNKRILIRQNEDEMRWEFISGKAEEVFYFADSDKEFPPSSGWNKTKLAELPNPGVRLDSIRKQEKDDKFFEDDPYKFSPFIMNKFTFAGVKNDPLGFDLKILQLHAQFVAVRSIKPGSQSEAFGVEPDDILVSANEVDLSRLKTINAVSDAIGKIVKSLPDDNDNITVTFARKKEEFKVLICQRAGTKAVNGKYSIEGMENEALMFANNNNKNFKIMRIYVNEEEDEAIWALREVNIHSNSKGRKRGKSRSRKESAKSPRKHHHDDYHSDDDSIENHRDYYIVLAHASEEVPPECAWEAVDPHGLWPAAGLQYYDVRNVPPSKPKIVSTQPKPNAVQIRFECDEEGRRPKVCPHMEVWYEVEMRHYKYNTDTGKTKKKPAETKIWRTNESPFVANKLVNGDDYEFIVRSCNHISHTNSEISPRVTPLQLPPKPKILDITGEPGVLFVHFHCPHAKDREIQAKFEISIDPPPVTESDQDYPMKDGRFQVDNDNKPVRLKNLINGTMYRIMVSSVNCVGVTFSEPEEAYPSKEPPQPELIKVKAGNREIVVDFKCKDWDRHDTLAWFEMVLDPEPPSIDQAGILVRKTSEVGDIEDDEKSSRGHYRQRSRMRSKLKNKSRWRRQTMSQRNMQHVFYGGSSPGSPSSTLGPHFAKSPLRHGMAAMTGHRTGPKINRSVFSSGPSIMQGDSTLISGQRGHIAMMMEEEKSTDAMDPDDVHSTQNKKWTSSELMKMYEDDDFVPYYRRNIRHRASPVKISPVVNGIAYIVQVKAVTLSGSKISAFSQAVTPKGPPPIPKISKLMPLESSVKIEFVCNDYATEEYRAEFEVQTNPQTVTMKNIRESPYEFPRLKNGRGYKFHVRGVNKEGRSKWSEVSKPVGYCYDDDDDHHRDDRKDGDREKFGRKINTKNEREHNENAVDSVHSVDCIDSMDHNKENREMIDTKCDHAVHPLYPLKTTLCPLCHEYTPIDTAITRRYTKQYTNWYYKKERTKQKLKDLKLFQDGNHAVTDYMAIECRQKYLVPLDPT